MQDSKGHPRMSHPFMSQDCYGPIQTKYGTVLTWEHEQSLHDVSCDPVMHILLGASARCIHID